jgi:hypothetical protein
MRPYCAGDWPWRPQPNTFFPHLNERNQFRAGRNPGGWAPLFFLENSYANKRWRISSAVAELGMRLGYECLFERFESDSMSVRLSRLKLAPD